MSNLLIRRRGMAKVPEVPYKDQYLTFEALESGTFQFTKDINYSINGGAWTALEIDTPTPTLSVGDTIRWKATNTPDDSTGVGTFSSTGQYNAYGNPYSLRGGDNFKGVTALPNPRSCFRSLFQGNTLLVNAENIALPFTSLREYCYFHMFHGCTSLITTPELPAKSAQGYCYSYMFYGCTSLTTAPEINLTTSAYQCCSYMFGACTNLVNAPTVLPNKAPSGRDYWYMFTGCSNLETAPLLPALTVTNYSYTYMFVNCKKLNYIKAMLTSTPSNTTTPGWVSGVAATGTFVKNSAATWNVTGVNGIPTGWTIETADS